jgi:ribA/ribD-fused uncharacterized protein
MESDYNLAWLLDEIEAGKDFKFLFFWGHRNSSKNEIGKSCFSQWFELPFTVDNVTYKTAEHWMMAHKALMFDDLKTYDRIIDANTPGEAKELGRQVLSFDEIIWNDKRYDIVKLGNIHKFNQYPQYAEYLMNTGNRILVEASPVDKIWGIGLSKDDEDIENPYCWRGLNLLGFALMEVRDFLKEHGHFTYRSDLLLPPWKAYPQIDSRDMFWRMGKGEGFIIKFGTYYSSLSERDKMFFKLIHPEPHHWKGFYSPDK